MALTKKYLKSKPVCKVTFAVPAAEANTVIVAGDFNNWDISSPLKKLKNGTFKGTFDIPSDNTYEFRYLVDGQWVNEAAADGYQWNDFAAAENGILKL